MSNRILGSNRVLSFRTYSMPWLCALAIVDCLNRCEIILVWKLGLAGASDTYEARRINNSTTRVLYVRERRTCACCIGTPVLKNRWARLVTYRWHDVSNYSSSAAATYHISTGRSGGDRRRWHFADLFDRRLHVSQAEPHWFSMDFVAYIGTRSLVTSLFLQTPQNEQVIFGAANFERSLG